MSQRGTGFQADIPVEPSGSLVHWVKEVTRLLNVGDDERFVDLPQAPILLRPLLQLLVVVI